MRPETPAKDGPARAASLWALAGGAGAWTLWRGFAGASRRLDSQPLVLAGLCWLSGRSPYSPETYSSLWQQVFGTARPDAFVFAYPPSSALLFVPLALPGVTVGLFLFDVLNVATLVLVWLLCARLASDSPHPWRSPYAAAAVVLACACGSLSAALLLGQTSLWIAAAISWLWLADRAPRLGIAEVLALTVAAMKPNLTLPVLCFLGVLRPKLVAAAGAVSLVLCAAVAAATGGAGVIGEWLRAVSAYAAASANSPLELASAQNLVARVAPELPSFALAALGGALGALVGWDARRRAPGEPGHEHWIAAIALALACSPAHGYDLVLAAPLAALLPRVRRSAWPWYGLGLLAVARPAVLARAGALAGIATPQLEGLISASGTAVLALGAGAYVALRRPLFAVQR